MNKISPRYDFVLKSLITISGLNILAGLIFPSWANHILGTMMSISILSLVTSAGIASLHGHKVARFFNLGWGTLIICVIVWLLAQIGYYPMNEISYNAATFGSLLESIFMYLALAERFQEAEKGKAMATFHENESYRYRYLTRILCHDIINPLSVINGNVQILQMRQKSDEKQQKCFKNVERAVGIITEIIDHVRKYEGIRSGKIKMNLKPVAVNEVIDQAKFVFAEKLREKNITLEVSCKEKLGEIWVMADKTSFCNDAFNNVLSNAIKFSFSGGSICIKIADEGNDSIAISIIDHGMGIPQEIQKHIFDSGYSVSRLGTNGEKGTGFGLELVKELVERSDGRVCIESKEKLETDLDHGTCFKLIVKKATRKLASDWQQDFEAKAS